MNFLYYAYGGICCPHPHNAINKANGLFAAAPLTPSWPGLPPLVDIPNWDDDIYLKRRGADAFFGSRFAKSELYYAQRVVFLLLLWTRGSASIPNAPSCTPIASKWHRERPLLIYCPHIIHPLDLTRLANPASSSFPMVQEPSSTLHGTVCTIPTFDFGLPVVLFFFHEQLLSNAVAQMMTPPRAGMAAAMTPHLSESDMAKMRKPHIVYASSYDAIYF